MAASVSAVQLSEPGAPQVGVTVSGLSEVTGSTVTVDVSWDGGVTYNAVRGGTVTGVLGSTFIRDHVPALGVESTYRATVTVGSDETATGTVTAESDFAWIQDPLDPATAVAVTTSRPTDDSDALLIMAGSMDGFTSPVAVDTVTPLGARLPVASIGQALAFQGLPMTFQTPAAQGALIAAMRNLLTQAGQIVMRGLPSSLPIDPVAHVVAVNRQENVTVGGMPGRVNTWTMSVSQVRPTSLAIVIPWWIYDQVKALVVEELGAAPTYDDVTTAMPAAKTYTEWFATPGTAS